MGSVLSRGIFDKTVIFVLRATLISKGALKDGSSKHGNTRLA